MTTSQAKRGKDGFGGVGATMVDSLDTLWLMGLKDEFKAARDWTANELSFDRCPLPPRQPWGWLVETLASIRATCGPIQHPIRIQPECPPSPPSQRERVLPTSRQGNESRAGPQVSGGTWDRR